MNAFSRRRQKLAEIGAKSDILNELVPAIRTTERVIVFTERQEAAEQVAATLSWHGIRAGAVHSGLPGISIKVSTPKAASRALDSAQTNLHVHIESEALMATISRRRFQLIDKPSPTRNPFLLQLGNVFVR